MVNVACSYRQAIWPSRGALCALISDNHCASDCVQALGPGPKCFSLERRSRELLEILAGAKRNRPDKVCGR